MLDGWVDDGWIKKEAEGLVGGKVTNRWQGG